LCHGGVSNDKLSEVNMEALEKGVSNLEKQLENLNYFGPPVVVALNEFPGDTQ
jgi:formate--tetrahydrofolate ligase